MKIKLFGNKIEPACCYCRYGRRNAESEKVFCEKKGIVDAYSSCRKYRYNPLKRVPQKVKVDLGFSKKDFEL